MDAAVGQMGGDWPKASIGNYKGVMLCNRPNEFGLQRKPERSGNLPFNSRVNPLEPVGWNPTQKLLPKSKKKKSTNGVLLRHKQFLKSLEDQKNQEREEMRQNQYVDEIKAQQFKDQAQQQRAKVRQMQDEQQIDEGDDQMEFEEEPVYTAPPMAQVKQTKLTEDNLSKMGSDKPSGGPKSQKSVKSGKSAKKSAKPAWAVTPKQVEDEKEAEIDDLIEFAYDLDYEKYMEDYEVRQALAIIKDRVNEIKQDDDWKENIAEEWNQAAAVEAQQAQDDARSQRSKRSVFSYKSGASNASRMSMKSRIADEKKRETGSKADWQSQVSRDSRKMSTEDRVAARIANEVLRDNAKLRGVHSGASIKKILEREAKKQLLQETGGKYDGPVISQIKERGERDPADPSNLPYLNKCPAV